MLIPMVLLAGIAVALIRRRLAEDPASAAAAGDTPARLVGWAAGLRSPQREDWGQAMLGELDRLDGPARRWRFAVGCAAGALVVPPWGRAATGVGSLAAIAAVGGGLAAYTHVHCHLGTDGWTVVGAAVLLVFLVGYLLAGSVLLRRPGVAGPGLIGGVLVAVSWLAVSGFTFTRLVNSLWSDPWLLALAPVVVGVGGTLWGGSAAVGRRAARLAAVSAGLGLYLYGVLAVAVVGATGHDPSDHWTAAQVVSDNLGNQAGSYLIALPLVTATLGWAAAAATARLRHLQPLPAPPHPVLVPSGAAPAMATPWRRTGYPLLLGATLAGTVVMAFIGLLRI